jgi:hypothetical protein
MVPYGHTVANNQLPRELHVRQLELTMWLVFWGPYVRAGGDAGSRRLLVSRLLGSRRTIGPESRRLWVWSLKIVQR